MKYPIPKGILKIPDPHGQGARNPAHSHARRSLSKEADKELGEYIVDFLEPLGDVQLRRFFGGWGFVLDSVQFGVILLGTPYFCVDDVSRQKYIDEDCGPFEYDTKKRHVIVQRFYEIPARLLEGDDEIVEWAAEAWEVSKKKKS